MFERSSKTVPVEIQWNIFSACFVIIQKIFFFIMLTFFVLHTTNIVILMNTEESPENDSQPANDDDNLANEEDCIQLGSIRKFSLCFFFYFITLIVFSCSKVWRRKLFSLLRRKISQKVQIHSTKSWRSFHSWEKIRTSKIIYGC